MTVSNPVSPRMRRFIMFVDRIVISITKHWLLLVSFFIIIFAGLPILAPVFMHYGFTGPADLIYKAYSLTCHQLSQRSFFFFGEQSVYTLDELRTRLNVHGEDILYWREFIGNPQMGYKMAWCERDHAMYLSLLISGIFFGFVRQWLKPLNWRLYLLFLAPLAIDGTWQLLTSPYQIVPFLPVHESDYILRTITGILFGIGSAWLVYPYVEEAMRDAYDQAKDQYQRALARETEASQSSFLQGK
jgi:uncharacterized membrane protein